jgi:hypothetical protein
MPKLQGLQLSLFPEFRSPISPVTTMKISKIDVIALAKVQYCIYGNALDWKNSLGDILQWEELPTKVKKHWIELAETEIKENLQQLISRYENYSQ